MNGRVPRGGGLGRASGMSETSRMGSGRVFPALPAHPDPHAPFATSWWGNAWIDALEESALDRARLVRGRAYARQGAVDTITVAPGRIVAYVHGSRPRPYRAEIRLRTMLPAHWDRFLDAVATDPAHIAALLDKDMPHALAEAADRADVPLLPGARELAPSCTCPDRGHPCKHAAALAYQTARLLDADPFVLMLLRGGEEQDLLDELSHRNARMAAAEQQPSPAFTTPDSGPTASGSAASPGSAARGSTARGSTAPGSSALGFTASGATAPASPALGSTPPGSTALRPTAPGSTAPGSAAPGSTVPGSTAPGSTALGSTASGAAAPASPALGSTVPASPAPGSTGPGSTASRSVTSPSADSTPAASGAGEAGLLAPLPGIPARDALAAEYRPAPPPPLPPPPHPGEPPVLPSLPGAPDAASLEFLITDAAARAHAFLTAGTDPFTAASPWHDAVRLAASHPGLTGRRTFSRQFAALARSVGSTPADLSRAAAAWRQGGEEGLAVLETPWDPPAGPFDRARGALAEADLPRMTIHHNTLTNQDASLQLRYGHDGRWYPYRSDPGADDWWPEGEADVDVVGALTAVLGS